MERKSSPLDKARKFQSKFTVAVPELYEKRWADICEIGRILKSLEPFVLSGKPIVELPVKDVRGRTRAVMMTDEKGAHRVLVIGLDYDNEAQITLPPDCKSLKSRFGFAKPQSGNRQHFKAGLRSCDLLQ